MVAFPISQPADNAAPYTYTQPIRDAIATANDHETRVTSNEARLDGLDTISNVGNSSTSRTLTAGSGNGTVKLITLNANCAFTFTTPPNDGRVRTLELLLTQDGTGSRIPSWVSTVKWPGGTAPTLSTAPGAIDHLVFVNFLGSATWYGNLVAKGYA